VGYASAWRAPWSPPGDLASVIVVADGRPASLFGRLVDRLEEWARGDCRPTARRTRRPRSRAPRQRTRRPRMSTTPEWTRPGVDEVWLVRSSSGRQGNSPHPASADSKPMWTTPTPRCWRSTTHSVTSSKPDTGGSSNRCKASVGLLDCLSGLLSASRRGLETRNTERTALFEHTGVLVPDFGGRPCKAVRTRSARILVDT
jgi:hypothetical protein